MPVFDQRTQIVAGSPIEVSGYRLLPSVLVQSMSSPAGAGWLWRGVRMRPISLVVEGPEGARWHAIPNTTADLLSQMAAVGLGVAALGTLLLVARWVLRRAG